MKIIHRHSFLVVLIICLVMQSMPNIRGNAIPASPSSSVFLPFSNKPPRLLPAQTFSMGGESTAYALTDTHLWLGEGRELVVIDLADSIRPRYLSSFHLPAVAKQIVIQQPYAYIVLITGSLMVLDISRPSQIQLLDHIFENEKITQVTASKSRLFVDTATTLRIFAVLDNGKLHKRSTINQPEAPETHTLLPRRVLVLPQSPEFAIVHWEVSHLELIDTRDPDRIVRTLLVPNALTFAFSESVLYVLQNREALLIGSRLVLFDLKQPTAPIRHQIDRPNTIKTTPRVDVQQGYWIENWRLHTFNHADPFKATAIIEGQILLAPYTDPCASTYIFSGLHLITVCFEGQVAIYDIRQLTQPKLLRLGTVTGKIERAGYYFPEIAANRTSVFFPSKNGFTHLSLSDLSQPIPISTYTKNKLNQTSREFWNSSILLQDKVLLESHKQVALIGLDTNLPDNDASKISKRLFDLADTDATRNADASQILAAVPLTPTQSGYVLVRSVSDLINNDNRLQPRATLQLYKFLPDYGVIPAAQIPLSAKYTLEIKTYDTDLIIISANINENGNLTSIDLARWDISDPNRPKLKGQFQSPSLIRSKYIVLKDGLLFLGLQYYDERYTTYFFDLANQSNLQPNGTLAFDLSRISSMLPMLQGRMNQYAYVSTDFSTIKIFELRAGDSITSTQTLTNTLKEVGAFSISALPFQSPTLNLMGAIGVTTTTLEDETPTFELWSFAHPLAPRRIGQFSPTAMQADYKVSQYLWADGKFVTYLLPKKVTIYPPEPVVQLWQVQNFDSAGLEAQFQFPESNDSIQFAPQFSHLKAPLFVSACPDCGITFVRVGSGN